MHKAVKDFCKYVKKLHPDKFRFVSVVDFGSCDINGNNRYLFKFSRYTGVDIYPGKNVDVICKADEYLPKRKINVVISTEMLEHDRSWDWSINNMVGILEPGGLLLLTFATEGREEHGTKDHKPNDSPATIEYYHNITFDEFKSELNLYKFKFYEIKVNSDGDMLFWGIKK